jgi:hypothetical protein
MQMNGNGRPVAFPITSGTLAAVAVTLPIWPAIAGKR